MTPKDVTLKLLKIDVHGFHLLWLNFMIAPGLCDTHTAKASSIPRLSNHDRNPRRVMSCETYFLLLISPVTST